MLAVVRKLITGKGDDIGALQRQIQGVKREGQEASGEIERLKRERAAAVSYDEARDLDDRINRQIWASEHAAQLLPQLELELGAARAAQQAQALTRHTRVLIDLYPRLKAAILAAVEAQEEVIAARQAAIAEIGEAMVSRNLPALGFAGFIYRDLVEIWSRENDRVVADLARQPKPAAIPAPVRAALPAPTKSKAPVAVAKAPRPARVVRHDAFPTDGQQSLVVFLRGGAELPDGSVAGIGDEIALPAEQARRLVERGAAEFVTAAVPGKAS